MDGLKVRRIVTGQTEDGANAFTHVEPVEPIASHRGAEVYGIWKWTDLPQLPFADFSEYVHQYPDGRLPGHTFVQITVIPPGTGCSQESARADRPGPTPVADAINTSRGGGPDPVTGRHCSNSVDVGFVLAGEAVLEQDGTEVVLRHGDVFVQHGAVHAWSNRTDKPAAIGYVHINAARQVPGGS